MYEQTTWRKEKEKVKKKEKEGKKLFKSYF